MTNKEILKRKIIYRSKHRGTKEMDLLLEAFVKKYIDLFDENSLEELLSLLSIDDQTLTNWYFGKSISNKIPINKTAKILKNFTIKNV